MPYPTDKNFIDDFKASVRPGLAWLFGIGVCVMAFFGKITPGEFMTVAGGAISSYFVSRQGNKNG